MKNTLLKILLFSLGVLLYGASFFLTPASFVEHGETGAQILCQVLLIMGLLSMAIAPFYPESKSHHADVYGALLLAVLVGMVLPIIAIYCYSFTLTGTPEIYRFYGIAMAASPAGVLLFMGIIFLLTRNTPNKPVNYNYLRVVR